MALNLLPVIKLITKSSSIAGTVNTLIKQFNSFKSANENTQELRKALEVQSALNEKLETQITILQSAIDNLQKSVRMLTIIIFITLAVSIAAIIVAILN